MLLLGMPMYAVKTAGSDLPPPGAGVVTVKFKLPGRLKMLAGRFTVIWVELTTVAAMFVPLIATVEFDVKSAPVSVTWTGTPMGAAAGERRVSVGAGGFVMLTWNGKDVVTPGVDTVICAVPALVRSAARTLAFSCGPEYP